MKRSWRSSSSRRSLSSGAITTNFERSKAMWRSISGKVPLPIEPKPIITIGPSKRACSGQPSVVVVVAVISVTPGKRLTRSRSARPMDGLVAVKAGNERGEIGLRRERAAGADQPLRALECARREFARKQAVLLVGPGQPQRARILTREAEPPVIRSVADQQHSAMTATGRFAQRLLHQGRADAALAAVGRDRERAEQQRRPARAGRDAPQPYGADEATAFGGNQRQLRLAAFAQALRGLGEAHRPIGKVEQRLARRNLPRPFMTDGDYH